MCEIEMSFNREGGYTMGIGSVTSMNSMSGMQMNMARSTDSESKNIKNEITGIQQQMQQLSSKEELSVDEKTNERKKLQREISGLNTELKQHQDELIRSQRREILMAELQKDKELTEEEKSEDKTQTGETAVDKADEKKLSDYIRSDESDEAKVKDIDEKETKKIESDVDTDTGLSHKEAHAIVSADTSVRQAARQGTVIARIRDGIVILKGEINQDEKRGVDTEKKQAELEKMEKKEQRARASQFSVLGDANKTMKSAAETKVNGTKNSTQVNTENNAFIKAFNLSKEDNFASQQRFYISIGK